MTTTTLRNENGNKATRKVLRYMVYKTFDWALKFWHEDCVKDCVSEMKSMESLEWFVSKASEEDLKSVANHYLVSNRKFLAGLYADGVIDRRSVKINVEKHFKDWISNIGVSIAA